MSDFSRWSRRNESPSIRPTVDRRRVWQGCAAMATLALLMVLALIPGARDEDEAAQQVRSGAQTLTAANCQLIQELTYTPCGHKMTRRQMLPPELIGQGHEAVSAAYDQWLVISFSAEEVVMQRTLSLYCPDHMVLLPDTGGVVCVFQNRYGDALGLVKCLDVPVGELPDSVQEEVRRGKGFASVEEAEKWLENVGS